MECDLLTFTQHRPCNLSIPRISLSWFRWFLMEEAIITEIMRVQILLIIWNTAFKDIRQDNKKLPAMVGPSLMGTFLSISGYSTFKILFLILTYQYPVLTWYVDTLGSVVSVWSDTTKEDNSQGRRLMWGSWWEEGNICWNSDSNDERGSGDQLSLTERALQYDISSGRGSYLVSIKTFPILSK